MTDTVSFQQDTCHITLYLSKLSDLPLKNIRKLFSMMLSEPWNNEAAITATGAYLEDAVVDSKAAWADASREYQNKWRLVRNKKSRTAANLEILQENKRLSRELRRAKAQHERWVKIQAIWNDTKHKMN